jgi:hypothetical protein
LSGKSGPSRRRKPSEPTGDEPLILAALQKVLERGEALPLFGAEGLFPARTSATRAALERCRRDRLLEDTPEGAARITTAGVEHLLTRLPPDTVAGLLRDCVRREEDRLRALGGEVSAVRERLAYWHDRLAQLGREELKSVPPTAERDYMFQRTLVQHVVFAWEETLGTEASEAIERALFNAGVEPLGRPGERLPFVPRHHDCEGAALPGDPVEVVRCGWLLRDDRGESVLALARVRRLSAP